MTEQTFKSAYAVLQRHAETLRTQREPNVDDLLTMVTESVYAYKVCKARIEAVEKALEAALGDVGLESNDTNKVAGTKASSEADDDMPF